MAKGITYLAVTKKSGLLKIGKVDSQDFLQSISSLEKSGYVVEFASQITPTYRGESLKEA